MGILLSSGYGGIVYKVKTLADIPESIKNTFTPEELQALTLLEKDAEKLKAYYQLETGEFDCIGFVSPGGKITKFAEIEKYNALLILENRIRRELSQKEIL